MADADELLRQIHERPDDDAARLVYADSLLEQPSPAERARGEFIMLQFEARRRPLTDGELARAAELVAAHRAAWLGPVHAVIPSDATRFRFERGFLHRCRWEPPSHDDAARAVGQPAWATVVRIELGPAAFVMAPEALATVGHAAMRSLREVSRMPAEAALGLARGPEASAVESLGFVGPATMTERLADALAECPGLPHLRRLEVQSPTWDRSDGETSAYRWLFDGGGLRRLESVAVACGLRTAAAWLDEIDRRAPSLRSLTLIADRRRLQGVHARFERGDNGHFSSLVVEFHEVHDLQALGNWLLPMQEAIHARVRDLTLTVVGAAGLTPENAQRGEVLIRRACPRLEQIRWTARGGGA